MKKIYWVLVTGLLVWNILITISLMNIASTSANTTSANAETAVISHTVHEYTTDITESIQNVQSKIVTVNIFTDDKNIAQTGVIYSSNSSGTYIVTSANAIHEEDAITVCFDNTITLKASLIGEDAATDIAVVLVTADFETETVNLGDSDLVKAGEYVFSLSGREEENDAGIVSFGVISSKMQSPSSNRDHIAEVLLSDMNSSDLSSGAPVFNANGDMVGMISNRLVSSSKYTTAISVNELKLVADKILSTDTVERGYLGIIGRNVQDMNTYEKGALSLQLDVVSGVLVTRVLEESPAMLAGIQMNDVIVGMNDTDISNLKDLRDFLYSSSFDEAVTVVINRQGSLLSETIILR